MYLSIVIPSYDSGARIFPLYQRLVGILSCYSNYEIIFVDDGSKEGTVGNIKELKKHDPHVRIIQLKSHLGQYAALFAGYKCCRGKIVISLDDDAFEEARHIPEFIRKIEEGADIVLGWRIKKGPHSLRKLGSYLFNIVISLIAGKRIHDIGSSLKARNRKAVDKLIRSDGLLPFLKNYRYFEFSEIRINYICRNDFPTRYSFFKLAKAAVSMLKKNIFNNNGMRSCIFAENFYTEIH